MKPQLNLLAGALAEFDRLALREKCVFIEDGGGSLIELEAVLALEREELIADYTEQTTALVNPKSSYFDDSWAEILNDKELREKFDASGSVRPED